MSNAGALGEDARDPPLGDGAGETEVDLWVLVVTLIAGRVGRVRLLTLSLSSSDSSSDPVPLLVFFSF